MKNTMFLIALFCCMNASAQVFEKMKLAENEIPAGYKLTGVPQCISIQACSFYDSPGIYSSIVGKLKSKDVQNFENDKDSGSIMFYEFEEKFEMEGFMQGFIWGAEKPTREHPERIFVKDKILIVYSFPLGSHLIEVLKKKVESNLK